MGIKKDTPSPGMQRALNHYLKVASTGAIYQIIVKETDLNTMYLRSASSYIKKRKIDIKQGFVSGKYVRINEHELKQWSLKDNELMNKITQKLIKRIILCQLLLESDDDLKEFNKDSPRLSKLIDRSNRECERIACEQYDKLYDVDKDILLSLMNNIDEMTESLSKVGVADFFYVKQLVDQYLKNPSIIQDKAVIEITKAQ